eukprot:5655060-Pleurochrysis_carterae.AAC.1
MARRSRTSSPARRSSRPRRSATSSSRRRSAAPCPRLHQNALARLAPKHSGPYRAKRSPLFCQTLSPILPIALPAFAKGSRLFRQTFSPLRQSLSPLSPNRLPSFT